jgi:hypothetical protein
MAGGPPFLDSFQHVRQPKGPLQQRKERRFGEESSYATLAPTSPEACIAIIGATATVLAALLTGVFGMRHVGSMPAASPNMPAASATSTPAMRELALPSVSIHGPPTVPFGQRPRFTIVRQHAVRGTWHIGGSSNNEPVVVDPLVCSLLLENHNVAAS